MEQVKEGLTDAGVPYVSECLGGNIEGVRIGQMYIVEHGSGEGYYFGNLGDAGYTCYTLTLDEVIKLAKEEGGRRMKKLNQTVAVVEVGEDYTDRLRTVEVENCTLAQAQQIARDLGYQVITKHCTIVQTIDEVHVIVTVAPKEEEGEE